jgi:hypothetical protein
METLEGLVFSNGWEKSGRREKAERLATLAHAWNIGSDAVSELSTDQWLALATADRANQGKEPNNKMPSIETRGMVVRTLRNREDAELMAAGFDQPRELALIRGGRHA